HSAIFQCLMGEKKERIEKLILSASGGPFRGFTSEQLRGVSPEMALKHPKWDMGKKVSIDSATLMNKGLEVIEASRLFQIDSQRIEVVIHPQSLIHSMVQFVDGSVKAQIGLPDMRVPILFSLTYPDRYPLLSPRWDFSDDLTFSSPDRENFPCLSLAYKALEQGGNMPCMLNAANEIAVESFLGGDISFTDIPHLVETGMGLAEHIVRPTYDDLLETDLSVRNSVRKEIQSKIRI
ncbi:MAG: 1-deoxy-D-xylulose-5-phosphate reductoisomerase, partial [Cytophagales bacterium]|nr:1-deoxy-D-xylulose-5-phosphate reductoisomerase [Cytophagales bacterium]